MSYTSPGFMAFSGLTNPAPKAQGIAAALVSCAVMVLFVLSFVVAVVIMADLMAARLHLGCAEHNKAERPLICGHAMDVPDMKVYCSPQMPAARMSTPGAAGVNGSIAGKDYGSLVWSKFAIISRPSGESLAVPEHHTGHDLAIHGGRRHGRHPGRHIGDRPRHSGAVVVSACHRKEDASLG